AWATNAGKRLNKETRVVTIKGVEVGNVNIHVIHLKAQQLTAERETTYTPFVPQAVLPSSYTTSEIDISLDKSLEQRALLVESRRMTLSKCFLCLMSFSPFPEWRREKEGQGGVNDAMHDVVVHDFVFQ
ncbi:unnamed protein product, partial [Ilex paraguariensis]